ncbi:MAG: prepilin-type N-terminal cleavage/methylation domain-containing protein [Syntrophomonadaceae bacterium]|nr:prepilin-type N-terminal cleavage/methylation domain-containing protein [Syntrophomonadaceae bacterium]
MQALLLSIKLWREKGFTLIELLASLSLISLVLLTASTVLLTGQKALYQNGSVLEMQQASRSALQFMVREIRSAQEIVAIQPNTLTLINHDGNKIAYRLSGGTLWRDFYLTPTSTIRSTSHPLANQIVDITFTASENRGVKIYLTVSQKNKEYYLSTFVYPRVE